MFKFLKDKIKDAVKKFSKSTTVEIDEIDVVQEQDIVQEKVVEKQLEKKQPKTKKSSSIKPVVEKNKKKSEFKKVKKESIVEKESLVEEEIIEFVEPETLISKETTKSDESELSEDVKELVSDIEDSVPSVVEKDVDKLFVDEDSKDEQESLVESDVEPELETELKVQKEKESESNNEVGNTVELSSSETLENKPIIDSKEDEEKLELAKEQKKESEPELDSELDSEKKPGFFKRLFSKKEIIEEVSEPIIEDKPTEFKDLPNSEKEIIAELSEDVSEETTKQSEELSHIENVVKVIDESVDDVENINTTSETDFEKENKINVAKELLDADVKDATKKKKGFFARIKEKVVKFKLTDDVFEDLFWDFELALLENNVALEVIEKIKSDLHDQLTQENISRGGVDQVIFDTLKKSLDEILTVETFDLVDRIKTKKPFIISLIGVNGSGKTTTLAKIIHLLQKKDLSVVVAASDTFRAAAIQQLEEHTNKLGVKLIKHDYNADPSAVAFDAISHAKAKGIDVVLIDTAGRLQSNSNLMDELKKLIRVNSPDLNIFIGESVTGNDCVEQAMAFNEAVGIDGIILSKADIDDKGGAAISVSYVTKKPILYLGTGQTYDDLKLFDKFEILDNLGL